MNIDFFKHNIEESDISRVIDVLHSTFLTNASVTLEFEKKLSQYLKIEHTIAVSSCTAALHLALLVLGIGKGDEVITSPMSFIATSNAIIHAGATPVFVDIEPTSGNINVNLIEQAITPKTKAILPIHLYGNMADMKSIRKIADKYKLKIIEDAAHCIEGNRDNIGVGELSDMVCFSFYATKNITSGEGGAISCHNKQLADKLKQLRLHGMSKDAASRHGKRYVHWDMLDIGWKYNITDIQSALLIGQLDNISKNLARRRNIAKQYHSAFSKENIEHIWHNDETISAFHLFTILVDKRDDFLNALNAKGIGATVNYNPIHLTTYYKNTFNFMPNTFLEAEKIGLRTISIPLYPKLTFEQVQYIIKTIIELHYNL